MMVVVVLPLLMQSETWGWTADGGSSVLLLAKGAQVARVVSTVSLPEQQTLELARAEDGRLSFVVENKKEA